MGAIALDQPVIDNKDKQRFELRVGDAIAFADYRIAGDKIYFTHTITPPALRGQGVASALAHGALTSAKAQKLTIVPQCSFIAEYLERHPEFG
jgi:hypothetical protein